MPYVSSQFGDGSAAHLPWLQEMPDPLTSAMWSSWVEINPQTAERMHIAQGDVVEVRSSQGTLRAPAMIFPGIAPEVIAMPIGQGHENFTRYASKRGVNPIAILAPATEPETGALAWAATRVSITRVGRSRPLVDHVRRGDARTSARTWDAVTGVSGAWCRRTGRSCRVHEDGVFVQGASGRGSCNVHRARAERREFRRFEILSSAFPAGSALIVVGQ